MVDTIRDGNDLLEILDLLLRDEGMWWDRFYGDRDKPIPFFVDAPDESLVKYFETGRLTPGRVLELGCGPGRNALFFAERGCRVDAVDMSPVALDWARERAKARKLEPNFVCSSVFDFPVEPGAYDVVYDSGCFHHVPPHRRIQYAPLVERALKPDGLFALVCFRDGCPNGGTDISDLEVYRNWSMHGGVAYSRERLLLLFEEAFQLVEMRPMREVTQPAPFFGKDFCWSALFRKRERRDLLRRKQQDQG